MMRADRVYNKAGAPCMDCKRLTFELRRVCPWCAKARQAKIDAEIAEKIEREKLEIRKVMPDYPFKAEDCYENGAIKDGVRTKQRRIEGEGMNMRLADG
jgi:RNA polymerase subunit RPABC4/transcription elongation factor Spt4